MIPNVCIRSVRMIPFVEVEVEEEVVAVGARKFKRGEA